MPKAMDDHSSGTRICFRISGMSTNRIPPNSAMSIRCEPTTMLST